mgnify:FL=1
MNRFLLLALTAGLLMPNIVNANEIQKSKAIRLVINKYDQQLKKRLEGTGANPAYMAWVDDDCNVTIKAGTHQPRTFSTMEWFKVDTCKNKVQLIELNKK